MWNIMECKRIASPALSAERERRTENVFHMLLTPWSIVVDISTTYLEINFRVFQTPNDAFHHSFFLFYLSGVQLMFSNIYVLLIFREFCYMNKEIVINRLPYRKIHVEKKDWSYCHRNKYIVDFGIHNYKSVCSISKFQKIRRTKVEKLSNLNANWYLFFFELLITNPLLYSWN